MSLIDPQITEIGIQRKLRVLRRRIVGKSVRTPFVMPPISRPRFSPSRREYSRPRRHCRWYYRLHRSDFTGHRSLRKSGVAGAFLFLPVTGSAAQFICAATLIYTSLKARSFVSATSPSIICRRYSCDGAGQECYNYSPFIYARDLQQHRRDWFGQDDGAG